METINFTNKATSEKHVRISKEIEFVGLRLQSVVSPRFNYKAGLDAWVKEG